jgi:putative DNA primase/helicase
MAEIILEKGVIRPLGGPLELQCNRGTREPHGQFGALIFVYREDTADDGPVFAVTVTLPRDTPATADEWAERLPGCEAEKVLLALNAVLEALEAASGRPAKGQVLRVVLDGIGQDAGGGDEGDNGAEGAPQSEEEPLDAWQRQLFIGHYLTDLGNSQRLEMLAAGQLKFVDDWALWGAFNGRRWQTDRGGAAMRMAQRVPRVYVKLAATATTATERQQLLERSVLCQSARSLKAMIELVKASPRIAIGADVWDRHPLLLNVVNGTVDLATGRLLPHQPDHYFTAITSVPYDPSAPCPLWRRTLDEVFADDSKLIGYFKRLAGSYATGDVRDELLHVGLGLGGNGKDTLLSLMRLALGIDYASEAAPNTFMAKKAASDNASADDLYRLRRARLVTVMETGEGHELNEALIKSVTSGTQIVARPLYGHQFAYEPTFHVFLSTNHRPVIRGHDRGIWRRLRLIPFPVTFRDRDQDDEVLGERERWRNPLLRSQLIEELPGILAWMVEGAGEWVRDGLGSCKEVEKATKEWRDEQDAVAIWLRDNCERVKGEKTGATDLHTNYSEWAAVEGEEQISKKDLGTVLREEGFEREHTEHGSVWCGIRLKL